MDRKIDIVEVGPRDGLQNEPDLISTKDKLTLINRAIAAGARRLEVASFVHPQRVPQMADAEAVIAGLADDKQVSYIGLTLNKRGVLRAMETRAGGKRGIDEAGCVIVASDTFGQKNQGQTIAEGLIVTREMVQLAKAEGMRTSVTIGASFGCPFEGDVPHQRVIDMAKTIMECGPDEISLADTIGVGAPWEVTALFTQLREALGPDVNLRAHFHNTRGTGIANAMAAIDAGVTTLDASLGGLGGCPFAPKAAGNIATEDLVYLAQRSRISHGLDLEALVATNSWFSGLIGRELPSMVARTMR